MAEPSPKPWTLTDYLAWESQQPERYEFVGGVLRAMVGGTVDHNAITLNLARELDGLLRSNRLPRFRFRNEGGFVRNGTGRLP